MIDSHLLLFGLYFFSIFHAFALFFLHVSVSSSETWAKLQKIVYRIHPWVISYSLKAQLRSTSREQKNGKYWLTKNASRTYFEPLGHLIRIYLKKSTNWPHKTYSFSRCLCLWLLFCDEDGVHISSDSTEEDFMIKSELVLFITTLLFPITTNFLSKWNLLACMRQTNT